MFRRCYSFKNEIPSLSIFYSFTSESGYNERGNVLQLLIHKDNLLTVKRDIFTRRLRESPIVFEKEAT